MASGSLVHISLAWKCRLLFGLAVVLIMAVALLMPFQRMEMLADELNYRAARHAAQAVLGRPEVQEGDFDRASQQLAAWWPAYAERYELAVDVPQIESHSCGALSEPVGLDDFALRALRVMCPAATDEGVRPGKEHHRRDRDAQGQPVYRYALAVRGGGEGDTPESVLVGVIFVELPAAALVERPFWNRAVILAAGGAAGAAAILVFYLITQLLILSPVRKLRRVAEQVSAGHMSVRSRLATGDEFEQLGEAFNHMLEGLAASQEELRTINVSLDVKLGELAEANVALYEADRLKSEFLTNVTHELRTPLSSIIGFAELLNEAYEPGPDATRDETGERRDRLVRYAGNILTSGRMLLDIINDLLDLSKIEAGRMEVRCQPVRLSDVCETLIDRTRPLSSKRGLAVTLDLDDDLPTLTSDPGKIQQILYNLLSNAIKFSPPNGTITVSARRGDEDEDYVRLVVSDNGPGIPPEQHEIIFEKFRQADGSVTREHSGTGLGLPISRKLAHMLGGALTVRSAVGQGAMFTIVLPVRAPERSQRGLAPGPHDLQ